MPEARLSIDLNPIRGGLTPFALGFRPFFLGAGAAAVLLMAVWLAVLAGHLSPPGYYPGTTWHAHEMLFGYVGAVIAGFLRGHSAVAHVHYPGFPDFPQAELARRQMRRGGGLISFDLAGGVEAGETLMNYFARRDTPMELAVSLGSAISYIQHPASMTHAAVPEADRIARGITPGLIRLSVGLEGADVLIEHLDRGLAMA